MSVHKKNLFIDIEVFVNDSWEIENGSDTWLKYIEGNFVREKKNEYVLTLMVKVE